MIEIKYLDYTALIVAIVSVLIVGCVIDSGEHLVIIEEVPTEEPIIIPEPTTPQVIEQPIPVEPEAPVETTAPPVVKEIVEVQEEPSTDSWLTGVVIGIVSSRPDYSVGNIREDLSYRKYDFTTTQQIQRWQKVSFKVNKYSDVLEIIPLDYDNDGTPDIQTRTQGVSLKGVEGDLRVMEGTTTMIRHERDGKTYGTVKVHDGLFKRYAFISDDYFSNDEAVQIKIDKSDVIVEITKID